MIDILNCSKLSTTWALFGTSMALGISYLYTIFRIKCGPTPLPLFGNMLDIVKKGLTNHDLELIRDYGRIVGYYEGSTPIIMCGDAKFLKKAMIKDFNVFRNRRPFGEFFGEPFRSFLIALKDDEWKVVRTIVSPTFSSGKLKAMLKTMKPCSDAIIEHCEKLAEHDEYFEAKKIFGSFTLDTISSCCFGIRGDVLNEPDSEIIKCFNEIFGSQVSAKLLLIFLLPKFSFFLQRIGLIDFISKPSFDYLKRVTEEVINRRKSKQEFRNDFIQTMADYDEKDNTFLNDPDMKTNSTKKSLTNHEVMAQSVLFMLAGYETTATLLGYIAYNLALNPDCQKKLIEEIDECVEKHGEINYEMINDLPYLETVIDETLRLFPPAVRTDRIACEDYEYEGMKIPKGTIINISVWSLHHDSEIYPEPDKFIPERFNEENKSKRDNEAFMPFGAGPRYCIGMRFALMETKLLICELLTKFEFLKCDKTPMKIQIDDSGFAKSKEPIILKMKKRF